MKRKITFQTGVTDSELDWGKVERFVKSLEDNPEQTLSWRGFSSKQNFGGVGKSLVHKLADGTPHMIEIVWEEDE